MADTKAHNKAIYGGKYAHHETKKSIEKKKKKEAKQKEKERLAREKFLEERGTSNVG
tara:strand:+ start:1296 stop:1466 length:171 start_codon:yes stop_codon:yes gene_type:complete